MSDARVTVSVASVPLCRPQNSGSFWNFDSWQPMKSATEGLLSREVSTILSSWHKRPSVPEFIGCQEWKFSKRPEFCGLHNLFWRCHYRHAYQGLTVPELTELTGFQDGRCQNCRSSLSCVSYRHNSVQLSRKCKMFIDYSHNSIGWLKWTG